MAMMKRRYVYALIYAVPAFIVAAIVTVVVTVAIAGILWLFVYGDHPWPSFVDRYSPIFIVAVLATTWLALLSAVLAWGKRQEARASFDMKHVYFAAGATLSLVLLVLVQQRSVGNIGPQPDVIVCSDFCTARKFQASRFPQDGTCGCYDTNGKEALRVPMSRIRPR